MPNTTAAEPITVHDGEEEYMVVMGHEVRFDDLRDPKAARKALDALREQYIHPGQLPPKLSAADGARYLAAAVSANRHVFFPSLGGSMYASQPTTLEATNTTPPHDDSPPYSFFTCELFDLLPLLALAPATGGVGDAGVAPELYSYIEECGLERDLHWKVFVGGRVSRGVVDRA